MTTISLTKIFDDIDKNIDIVLESKGILRGFKDIIDNFLFFTRHVKINSSSKTKSIAWHGDALLRIACFTFSDQIYESNVYDAMMKFAQNKELSLFFDQFDLARSFVHQDNNNNVQEIGPWLKGTIVEAYIGLFARDTDTLTGTVAAYFVLSTIARLNLKNEDSLIGPGVPITGEPIYQYQFPESWASIQEYLADPDFLECIEDYPFSKNSEWISRRLESYSMSFAHGISKLVKQNPVLRDNIEYIPQIKHISFTNYAKHIKARLLKHWDEIPNSAKNIWSRLLVLKSSYKTMSFSIQTRFNLVCMPIILVQFVSMFPGINSIHIQNILEIDLVTLQDICLLLGDHYLSLLNKNDYVYVQSIHSKPSTLLLKDE